MFEPFTEQVLPVDVDAEEWIHCFNRLGWEAVYFGEGAEYKRICHMTQTLNAHESVREDPQVVNANGDVFELSTTGRITLLNIPREAHVSQAALVMVCDIHELEATISKQILNQKNKTT